MNVASYRGTEFTVDITGGVSLSPLPAVTVVPQPKWFKNGTNVSMVVNGSVTPVNFDVAPASGTTWYAYEITFAINDGGNAPPEQYGSLGLALANGVRFSANVEGADHEMLVLYNNADICLAFNEAVGKIDAGGFLNFGKGFVAKMRFPTPIALHGDHGDYLRVTVRDNLTGLNFQRVAASVFEALI